MGCFQGSSYSSFCLKYQLEVNVLVKFWEYKIYFLGVVFGKERREIRNFMGNFEIKVNRVIFLDFLDICLFM